jgi:hypothetical protein
MSRDALRPFDLLGHLHYDACGFGVAEGRGVASMSLASWRVVLVGLVAMAPGMAAAADLPPESLPPPPPTAPAAYAPPVQEWTVTLGVEPRAVPAWPGAKDTRFGLSVFPLFNIRKAGTPPEYFGGDYLAAQSVVLYRTQRAGGRQLRHSSRRLCHFLAGAVAAPAYRSSPGVWR